MSMNFLSPTKQTSSFFRIYQRDKTQIENGYMLIMTQHPPLIKLTQSRAMSISRICLIGESKH